MQTYLWGGREVQLLGPLLAVLVGLAVLVELCPLFVLSLFGWVVLLAVLL